MAGMGDGTVIVPWYATGFRAEDLEAALNEFAAVAPRYGASSYAVYRQRDDRYRFQQLAHFERYVDWERYWEGPEAIDFRVRHSTGRMTPLSIISLAFVHSYALAKCEPRMSFWRIHR